MVVVGAEKGEQAETHKTTATMPAQGQCPATKMCRVDGETHELFTEESYFWLKWPLEVGWQQHYGCVAEAWVEALIQMWVWTLAFGNKSSQGAIKHLIF